MPLSDYSESKLIEEPAIELLGALGWDTVNAYHEFDQGGSPLGRETKADVVLTSRLKSALEKLNPDLPAEAIDQALTELTRDRSRMSLVAANREVYDLIKNGVRVKITDPESGGESDKLIHVIDWGEPTNNYYGETTILPHDPGRHDGNQRRSGRSGNHNQAHTKDNKEE